MTTKIPVVAIRIYHPYWLWECYKAGFYRTIAPVGRSKEECLTFYRDFLSNESLFSSAVDDIFLKWPLSCEHWLSNDSINRLAWLGQASMCFKTGIPSVFRAGFNLLTEQQKVTANAVARYKLIGWINEFNRRAGV